MKAEELLKYCKYYKGEETAPQEYNNLQKMWWEGERTFIDSARKRSAFYGDLKDMYLRTLYRGGCSGILTDMKVAEPVRLLTFYLDVWHGKHFPFESLDVINLY